MIYRCWYTNAVYINRLTSIKTRKRGNAQRDGRPPLFYRRRTFVSTREYFVTTGGGWGPVWMIPLHCPTAKTHLCYKNLSLISYTSRVIANFVLKYPKFCRNKLLLKNVLRYGKSRPLTSLINIASEHSVIRYCFKVVKFLRTTEWCCKNVDVVSEKNRQNEGSVP